MRKCASATKYELYVSRGDGEFSPVMARANKEPLKAKAKELHLADKPRRNIYQIRLNGLVVEKLYASRQQSHRLRWQREREHAA